MNVIQLFMMIFFFLCELKFINDRFFYYFNSTMQKFNLEESIQNFKKEKLWICEKIVQTGITKITYSFIINVLQIKYI